MAHFGVKITIRQLNFRFSRTVPGGSGAFTAPSARGFRPRSIVLATVAPVPGMIGP